MKRRSGKKENKKNKRSARDRSRRQFQSEKLQNRIEKGQERSDSGGSRKSIIKDNIPQYRPGDGDHIIDIIPYLAGKNDIVTEEGDQTYTCEIHVHPNVGPNNDIYLCLARMFNQRCPICEDRQKLIEKGASKDEYKLLFPKIRHLYNVVSFDKEDKEKGVLVWDVSYYYSEKYILSIAKKKLRKSKKGKTHKIINFPDPKDGKSITFTIEPAKSKDDYPSYVGWAFEDRDYEIDDDTLEEAYCLDEIIHIPTYDEVKKVYYGSDNQDHENENNKDNEENDLDDILEELEDIEDMDELEDFVEEYEIDIKLKKKKNLEWNINKVRKTLEIEDEYDEDDIMEMKEKKLLKIIKKEDLNIDEDDWDNIDELRELIIEELDL